MNTATLNTEEAKPSSVPKIKPDFLMKALFQDTYVNIEDNNGNTKNASYKDFFSGALGIFSDKLDNSELQSESESIVWPVNTVLSTSESVTLQNGDLKKVLKLVVYFPAIVTDLHHRSTKVKNCHLPNILIQFVLNKVLKKGSDNKTVRWGVRSANYFCTPLSMDELNLERVIAGTDPRRGIYALALPNMYSDGRMCYGENSVPSSFEDNLRGLSWYNELIPESPFNSDLSIPGLSSSPDCLPWLRELPKSATFPYWKLHGSPWSNEAEFLSRNA